MFPKVIIKTLGKIPVNPNTKLFCICQYRMLYILTSLMRVTDGQLIQTMSLRSEFIPDPQAHTRVMSKQPL